MTAGLDWTLCLRQIAEGDRGAVDRLLPHVYEDLKRVAESYFRRQRGDHTLQPTVLVHEAYMRIASSEGARYEDRKHFLRVAALAMRQLLANYAEQRRSDKRDAGGRQILLDDVDWGGLGAAGGGLDLVSLHEALEKLSLLDERQARIVELRFLAGLTVTEVADVLGVTERTIYLDWRMARSFLVAELADEDPA